MYRVDRNNFYKTPKKATVYTPAPLSLYLFRLLSPFFNLSSVILDPCVGAGALLLPFAAAGYPTIGVDTHYQGFENTLLKNYLEIGAGELPDIHLVIMNPPFNIDEKTKRYVKKHYGGRPLLPEVWLHKALSLFGKDIPLVMFTPYGFRLNQTTTSRRWKRFQDNTYPEIKSIISLPKNIFEGILFHSEILIFNIDGLKAHYFYEAP